MARGDGQRQQVVATLELAVERVVIALSLNVVANLVAAPSEGGTPVDTGWARANWVPSVGQPFAGLAGSRNAVSFGEQAAGQAAVLGYRLSQGRAFVVNGVPYILRLNDGHSPQADPGFIERAIDKAVYADMRNFNPFRAAA